MTSTTTKPKTSTEVIASESSSLSFLEKLDSRCQAIDSLLCIGLDPHYNEIWKSSSASSSLKGEKEKEIDQSQRPTPEQLADAAFTFCKTLIDATLPYAACYKPNVAFFEALGPSLGMVTLQRVLKEIPSAMKIPILLDVKRGDIGTTASAYAQACYEWNDEHDNSTSTSSIVVDAVTLSPLMGWDSIQPFVTGKYANKGAFLLCKTSNPGSNDLLALKTLNTEEEESFYERIAKLSQEWSKEHGCTTTLGLVVGATDAKALSQVRKAAGPNVWILAPGVGAQGGNLQEALQAGLNDNGTGMLIPVSRGISQASDPALAAKDLRDAINVVRTNIMQQRQQQSKDDSDINNSQQDDKNDSTQQQILPYQREFIEFSLQEGVLKFGSFTLKSGRISPYFFNAGLFANGAALHKLGICYASAIMESSQLVDPHTKQAKFDVLFGPAYKGIPLGAVVSAALYSNHGINVGYAYNRKEAKDHGEGGMLVGADMSHNGKRVVVVDDVITAGTAIRESHTMLQSIGATMVGVVIALDRAEKRSLDDPVSAVQAVQRDLNVHVVSIVNLPQLQTFLESKSHPNTTFSEDTLKSVKDYRAQYGV